MKIPSRREFLHLLVAAGAYAQRPRPAKPSLSYSEVEGLLAGRKVFIVPYSHIDWSWTHSHRWQAKRAAAAIKEALDILQTAPDYRFYVDTWNEFVEPFLERYPERVGDFRKAVQAGQIGVAGGTVCNQHPSWMGSESLIRDMVMGRRLFQLLAPGVNLDVLTRIDVTPGPSQMPQIARKAGYRFYRAHRPEESFNAEKVPRNFRWQGLDGTEILVARGVYTGIRSAASLGDFNSKWEEAAVSFYQAEIAPSAEPKSGNVVWVPMGGDDVRPLRSMPGAGDGLDGLVPLREFVAKWNQREKSRMAIATPLEFFRELEKESASLPHFQGVLEQTLWTQVFGANGNDNYRLGRDRTDQALVSAETFWSCNAALGDAYPEKEFERLWLDLLRVTSHAQSWLFTEDYAEHLQLLKTTLALSEGLRDRAQEKIAGRVRVKENRPFALLFNDLPWERTEVAEIWATMPPGGFANIVVRDARGEVVPHQLLEANRQPGRGAKPLYKEFSLLVRARVPALGYTTLYFDPAEGPAELPKLVTSGSRLDTEFATVELSPRGIEFLLDKATGARYTGAGNVTFYEMGGRGLNRYGPLVKTLEWSDAQLEGAVQGPLRSSFTMKGALGPHAVRITGYLYPHARRIAFDTQIDSAGGNGHFMTTLGLPEPGKFTANVHFGVEERDLSRTVYEPPERLQKNVFYGSHWADYSNGRYGLAVVGTRGEKGYEILQDGKAFGHFLLRLFAPSTPGEGWVRFVNPAKDATGRHRFDYQFLLHPGDWKAGDIVRRAQEARHPLRVIYQDAPMPADKRTLPEEKSLLRLSPPAMQLSAFYRQGNRYLVRVYECSGSPGQASLELPFRVSSAREVDFNGQARRKKISVNSHTLRFEVQPWEIVTLEVA